MESWKIAAICTGIYLLINFIVLILYAADKRRAKREKWRISEKTLLVAAALGPLGAAVGMYKIRHKTQHRRFRILIPLFLAFHAVLAAAAVWFFLIR